MKELPYATDNLQILASQRQLPHQIGSRQAGVFGVDGFDVMNVALSTCL